MGRVEPEHRQMRHPRESSMTQTISPSLTSAESGLWAGGL